MACIDAVQVGQYINKHYPDYKVIVANPQLNNEQFTYLLGMSLQSGCLFISKRRPITDKLIKDFSKRPCMADIDYILLIHARGLQAAPILQEKDIDSVMRSFTDTACLICHEEAHENMDSSLEKYGDRITQMMPCEQCGKCICEACVNKLIKTSFEQEKSVICPGCRTVIIPYDSYLQFLEQMRN